MNNMKQPKRIMMRKLIIVSVALLFLVTLAASCSDDKNNEPLIGNLETKKFHYSDCSYLPDSTNRTSLADCDAASSGGYSPCGHCEPCGGKSVTAP